MAARFGECMEKEEMDGLLDELISLRPFMYTLQQTIRTDVKFISKTDKYQCRNIANVLDDEIMPDKARLKKFIELRDHMLDFKREQYERARHYLKEREEEWKRVWEFFGEPGPNHFEKIEPEKKEDFIMMWEPESWEPGGMDACFIKKKKLYSLKHRCFVDEIQKEDRTTGCRRLIINPKKAEMSLMYSFDQKRGGGHRCLSKKFYHNGFWTTNSLMAWEKAVFGSHVDFDTVSFLFLVTVLILY